MYQRILVPLDGSKAAEAALAHAQNLAAALGATVHLLRVVAEADAVDAPVVTDNPLASDSARELARRYLSANLAAAREYLSAAAAPIIAEGVRAEIAVWEGPAAEKIGEYARLRGIDLVAMSTRGRGAVQRLLLGSVTDRVLPSVGLPVLVIPPED
ncbi:MAG: universal stress protein [Dehalococcoidia bacterium]|nr:universal stress protein [Dehalococcoidia bacterium]MSQ15978.1 universal stress protein [Dehalococcoidia bacterium]